MSVTAAGDNSPPHTASPLPGPAASPLPGLPASPPTCPGLQLPSPATEDRSLSSPGSSVTLSPRGTAGPERSGVRQNHVSTTLLHGVPIVCLLIDGRERLCLAQISNTLLKPYSYNEIHNRRVALGITCVQCTPVQLEILRRAGAMPISSRRCGMITKREAERLVKSFLDDTSPPKLPDNFAFDVKHECGWGSRGSFIPSRYNSSRAKCIKCSYCNMYFSPNKFIFHFHRTPESKYHHPDAANFNSWRRHLGLSDHNPSDDLLFAWEDVKAMFNGGTRKRVLTTASSKTFTSHTSTTSTDRRPTDVKRPKFSLDAMATTGPRLPPPSPLHYPMFPKMLPSPGAGVKSLPPMFPLAHFHMGDKRPAPPSIKPPEVSVPNIQDTLYPPYEMIWAKHLGLNTTESGLVASPAPPRPYMKHSPCCVTLPSPNSPGSVTLPSPRQLSPAKPPTPYPTPSYPHPATNTLHTALGGSAQHTSAFKPVGNRKAGTPMETGRDTSPHSHDEDEDDSDGENVDVDTIDEVAEEQCEQNNNNNKDTNNGPAHQDMEHSEEEEEDEEDDDKDSDMEDSEQNTQDTKEDWGRQEVEDAGTSHPDTETPLSERMTPKDGVYRDFSQLSKEQLQEELLIEIQVRQKMEEDCRAIKETFKEQVDREKQYRDEMTRQLQIVRESLCQELDQERKARFTLQQKLKEAHDALHNFSCKMLASRQCAECAYKEPVLPR